MMLAYNGEIRQVTVSVVVEGMGVPHRTVVYVACLHFFYGAVVFEMSLAAKNVDDF